MCILGSATKLNRMVRIQVIWLVTLTAHGKNIQNYSWKALTRASKVQNKLCVCKWGRTGPSLQPQYLNLFPYTICSKWNPGELNAHRHTSLSGETVGCFKNLMLSCIRTFYSAKGFLHTPSLSHSIWASELRAFKILNQQPVMSSVQGTGCCLSSFHKWNFPTICFPSGIWF